MDFGELRAVVEHLVKSGLKPKDVLIELKKFIAIECLVIQQSPNGVASSKCSV